MLQESHSLVLHALRDLLKAIKRPRDRFEDQPSDSLSAALHEACHMAILGTYIRLLEHALDARAEAMPELIETLGDPLGDVLGTMRVRVLLLPHKLLIEGHRGSDFGQTFGNGPKRGEDSCSRVANQLSGATCHALAVPTGLLELLEALLEVLEEVRRCPNELVGADDTHYRADVDRILPDLLLHGFEHLS